MQVQAKTITLKNNKQITLRSATAGDAENMLRHLRIAHGESYKNMNLPASHWEGMKTEEEAKILADFEAAPGKFMLIALSEGRIIGGLGFFGFAAEFVKYSASIGMSIQQEFCNSGLGSAMMQYMLSTAKTAGFHRVELTVRTYNPAGIALYEKQGFKRVGLLKEIAFIDGQYCDEYSYQIIL